MVSCPLCSKTGMLLLMIGFAILLISTIPNFHSQLFMFVGLGFVLSAYIVPNFIKTKECSDGTCDTKYNK